MSLKKLDESIVNLIHNLNEDNKKPVHWLFTKIYQLIGYFEGRHDNSPEEATARFRASFFPPFLNERLFAYQNYDQSENSLFMIVASVASAYELFKSESWFYDKLISFVCWLNDGLYKNTYLNAPFYKEYLLEAYKLRELPDNRYRFIDYIIVQDIAPKKEKAPDATNAAANESNGNVHGSPVHSQTAKPSAQLAAESEETDDDFVMNVTGNSGPDCF